jgi:hypothetical protein
MVLALAGCSSGSGGTTGAGNPSAGKPSAGKPIGYDTPEQTLRELLGRIAAEDGSGACALFLPGAAATFSRNFDAADCTSAMDIVIGKITDREHFAAYTLKPSGTYPGVVVTGDSAEFGGACSGWTGSGVQSGLAPGDLGYFGLKKTADGWRINDQRLPTGSCGG